MMQNKATELSDAVVLFIGFRSASSPRRDHDRLVQTFGVPKAAAIESQVLALLAELGKIQIDWSVHSLESAGQTVFDQMHVRHPELSETALRALEWKFTFDWR